MIMISFRYHSASDITIFLSIPLMALKPTKSVKKHEKNQIIIGLVFFLEYCGLSAYLLIFNFSAWQN